MVSAEQVFEKARVFLSYSRKDRDSATLLVAHLNDAGFEAYLDTKDILPGEPWQERLGGLIANADAVVFLLSPSSIASSVCDGEVNEGERLGKRIIPLVLHDVLDGGVPGRLRRLNYSL